MHQKLLLVCSRMCPDVFLRLTPLDPPQDPTHTAGCGALKLGNAKSSRQRGVCSCRQAGLGPLHPLHLSFFGVHLNLGFLRSLGVFWGPRDVGSGDDCSAIGRFRRWLILLGRQWLLQGFQWDLLNEP